MSEFLRQLAARTLGLADVLQPRVASIFEPVGPAPSPFPSYDASERENVEAPSKDPAHESVFENETNPLPATGSHTTAAPLATALPVAIPPQASRGEKMGKFQKEFSTRAVSRPDASAGKPVPPETSPSLQEDSTDTFAVGPSFAERPEASMSSPPLRTEELLPPENFGREVQSYSSVPAHLGQKKRIATSPLREAQNRGEAFGAPSPVLVNSTAESQSAENSTSPFPDNFHTERLALQPSIALTASQILKPTGVRRMESARSAPTGRPPETVPNIQITIGRVEVRAALTGEPKRKERATPSVMSLEEYLSRRVKGAGK